MDGREVSVDSTEKNRKTCLKNAKNHFVISCKITIGRHCKRFLQRSLEHTGANQSNKHIKFSKIKSKNKQYKPHQNGKLDETKLSLSSILREAVNRSENYRAEMSGMSRKGNQQTQTKKK